MLCVQPWAVMFAERWPCCWLQGSAVTGTVLELHRSWAVAHWRVPELCSEYGNRMAACGGEDLAACLALLFPAEPTLLSKAVNENGISTAPLGFASSLLFVHGDDKRVKAA